MIGAFLFLHPILLNIKEKPAIPEDEFYNRKAVTSYITEDFAKPIQVDGKFDNPPSFNNWRGVPGAPSILQWTFLEKDNENVPKNQLELNLAIPVKIINNFAPVNPNSQLYATWLGHATVLVHMDGINFITDPIWAERAFFLSWYGPSRYRPPPMAIEDLPRLHFALISHDHYDHLDADAVVKIYEKYPSMRWYVPLGMEKWMESVGIRNTASNLNRVTEMNWGQSIVYIASNGANFTIYSVPAQHWGQRGPFDRNTRLWSGWVVHGPVRRFYYSGDTGFCDKEFTKIGNRLGPFDLSAIAIGAYEPRWFMKSQHINPEEAVELHQLVRSKFSIGIHWGTYHMGSYEHYLEPKQKLAEIMSRMAQRGVAPFVTIGMGETWEESA